MIIIREFSEYLDDSLLDEYSDYIDSLMDVKESQLTKDKDSRK